MAYDEMIDTQTMAWKQVAEELAKQRKAFVLVNFSYASHIEFYEHLRDTYGLKVGMDHHQQRAFFEPEKSN